MLMVGLRLNHKHGASFVEQLTETHTHTRTQQHTCKLHEDVLQTSDSRRPRGGVQ